MEYTRVIESTFIPRFYLWFVCVNCFKKFLDLLAVKLKKKDIWLTDSIVYIHIYNIKIFGGLFFYFLASYLLLLSNSTLFLQNRQLKNIR
jgi:hypothetical protein